MRKSIAFRLLAVCLSLVMIAGVFGIGASAETGTKDYLITNPYAEVDWDTWEAYKTQLHVHSCASDGAVQQDVVVEEHYKLGYDFLCLTDHALPGKGWNVVPQTAPAYRLAKYDRTKMAPVTPVTEERYQEILTGVGRDGRGMVDVKLGVELNGASPSNTHVNGFFADYGQGLMGVDGDYETTVANNGKLGGITFLNHLGYYTKAHKEKDPTLSSKPEYVNKFARLFLDYWTCVGMDINSSEDSQTEYDRILYDNVIQKTIPYGVLPWAFTFSDAHEMGQFDRAFSMFVLPEKTVEALRTGMETGTFFSIARYAVQEFGDNKERTGEIPMVNRITVDAAANSITLAAENYDKVVWVSNGNIIAEGETIDINDHEAEVTSYVRAYLLGEGGICYAQPFTVIEEGTTLEKEEIPATNDLSTFLRKLVNFLDTYLFRNNPIVRLFKKFALGMTDEQINDYYEVNYDMPYPEKP